MPNFPKNEHFLPPDMHTYVCVCLSGDKKGSFFGKFGMLCFLETPVSRFVPLALIPTSYAVLFYSRKACHGKQTRSLTHDSAHLLSGLV